MTQKCKEINSPWMQDMKHFFKSAMRLLQIEQRLAMKALGFTETGLNLDNSASLEGLGL